MNKRIKFSDVWVRDGKVHLGCWLLFILYECMISLGYHDRLPPFPLLLGSYAINITSFYAFAHIVLARALAFSPKRYFQLCLSITIWLTLTVTLKISLLENNQIKLSFDMLFFRKLYQLCSGHIFRSAGFAFMATAYYYFLEYRNEQDEKYLILQQDFSSHLLIQQGKEQIERNLIDRWKRQFDPHFIFQTFTYFQASVQVYSPALADDLVSFSRLIRYNSEAFNLIQEVQISSELEQIDCTRKLRSLVAQKPIAFELVNKLQGAHYIISPFLLVPLSSLIIDYALYSKRSASLSMHLSAKPDMLIIIFDNISASRNHVEFESALLPFSTQLKDYYGNRATLSLLRLSSCYRIEISIAG